MDSLRFARFRQCIEYVKLEVLFLLYFLFVRVKWLSVVGALVIVHTRLALSVRWRRSR